MIDLMHDFEELVRLEPVLLHQAAQRRAIAPVIVLLQPERLFVGDFEEIDDVVADAHVDLLPEIEVMRIKRVVEIEHPGLDMAEIRARRRRGRLGRLGTRCCHDLPMKRLGGSRIEVSSRASLEQSMRRTFRKSMPYLFALLAGTLAGACVAGFALFAARSK